MDRPVARTYILAEMTPGRDPTEIVKPTVATSCYIKKNAPA